jgi:TonB-dependent receptor
VKKLLSGIHAILLILATSAIADAQTGRITGKLTDKETGETLIGLTVKIKEAAKAVSTNVEGKYVLAAVQPGTYTLLLSYIGYNTKSIAGVEVKANETTTLDVIMEEAVSQALAEVVITTSAGQESVNSLYTAQKNSSRISDGISADAIRRSPDKNTSDVLKRVSGATIQQNKFVVVRGLSDRYNTAQLDNSPLPSTEPNKKAFSFDIVPSNVVDNIVVSKTATPDLSGDFAGGTVQIITKDVPDQNFTSFAAGFAYNTQSTFRNFRFGDRVSSDFFGFNNSRKLPANFPGSDAIITGKLTASQEISAMNSLNNRYGVNSRSALPGQNYQLTLGRVADLGKNQNRLGLTLSLSYRNSETASPDIIRQYHVYNFRDQQYKFSSTVGALANVAYTYKKSKITFKNIYNRIFDDTYTTRTGSNAGTSSADNRFYAFDLVQKSLLKSTLEGEHGLGKKNAKLRWNLGYSDIINDQPDQRKVNYKQNNPGEPFLAGNTNTGLENTRLFSYLSENIYSATLDYSVPVSFLKSTFKMGLSSQYRTRNFDVRFIGLEFDNNYPNANEERQRSLQTLFDADLINSGAYHLDEVPNANDRYDAHSYTHAGYVMLDSRLSEKIRAIYGLRAEKFDLGLNTSASSAEVASLSNLDLLPSVNLTYSLTSRTNIRASYYRTLARPEFRELAPLSYYDYELLATQSGNPQLKRSLIDNADLRYEIYPSPGQLFSFSVFYKNFQNAIESKIYDSNSTADISYFNAQTAFLYGMELELRKKLDFIGRNEFFDNTTFYSNFSLIKSEVTNPPDLSLKEHKRQLLGQSPYVINAGIQHSALDHKLSVNILYNRIGRRIFKAGGRAFPSVWEAPRNVLDLQVGLKVFKSKGEFKLNAGDVLNNSNVLYFDQDFSKNYTAGDPTISTYKPGANYSISFSYSFR